MSLVVVAESNGIYAQRLLTAATSSGHDVRSVDSLDAALEECERESVDVLVIGPSHAGGDLAFELAAFLRKAGRTGAVLAPLEVDATMLRAALRAGASDVISANDEISEISASINRAAEASSVLAVATSESGVGSGAMAGKVITVFSTKGGVGKTVLATNLAASIAGAGKKVVIVDLDLEFGDVGIMMGIRPGHTIFDAIQAFDRLDETMLEGFLETHSSDARVLLAPTRPEDAENISSPRVSRLIQMLQGLFDYVVIDTAPSFTDVVLAALDKSDEILVVTMMDVASIKNTRISLQKLSQMGYDDCRVKLVLNRADSKVFLDLSEVEKAITGPISAYIPSDRIVPRSVNKGVPVVMEAPRSAVSRAMARLAQEVSSAGAKGAADVA